MQLHSLRPTLGSIKKNKRLGRGNASGHGTFSGRGCKGQGQRKSGNVRRGFEGGQTPLIMRLPKLRGFKNINKVTYQVVNLSALNKFNDGDEVNPEILLEKKIISKRALPIKILGNGQITKKLSVKAHAFSRVAKAKIIQAGGKIL